ncbi:MAG: zinc ribbon domain-containing protein [Anaerolineales bacterium]|nr:zinc ribbon domain-containing protein [Anaerolineales bacterium]
MRRMFRRQRRKGFAPNVPPILQEANMAFEKGEYGRAAEKYEKLANVADARGLPRAAMLMLQAGRARIYAGQGALGLPSLRRGLELLAQRRQFLRLQRVGARAVAELKERGFEDEATNIEILLGTLLPESFSDEPQAKSPPLPTHCPSCGAPLRSDEVEWLDDVTAECGYCGSPIRAEN